MQLALLGAIHEGADNASVACALGVSEHTVGTMRRNLHHKLKLRHKGDVVRFAMENGFVRFSRGTLSLPGFAHLRAVYHSRRPRAKQGAAKGTDSRAA